MRMTSSTNRSRLGSRPWRLSIQSWRSTTRTAAPTSTCQRMR
ncbi:hypothetical protein ACFFX0_28490 [Citricoccus parietis]|uniref:Uncharacterized protein n=1 Tax=Citricoccus parietis TaxID=592307 RepID=A0ABV5FSQ4_9MICC